MDITLIASVVFITEPLSASCASKTPMSDPIYSSIAPVPEPGHSSTAPMPEPEPVHSSTPVITSGLIKTPTSIKTECSRTGPNKCLNGGVCLYDVIYNVNSPRYKYTCLCPCHYHGAFCELYSQNTSYICNLYKYSCDNGGSCVVSEGCRNMTCVCPRGYRGSHCQYRIAKGVCNDKIPCQNGGVCGYKFYPVYMECKCRCGFFGPLCQYSTDPRNSDYKNWCQTDDYTCHNGGSCFYDSTSCTLKCSCVGGYEGHDCSTLKTTTTTTWCAQNKCEVTYSDGNREKGNTSSIATVISVVASLIVTAFVVCVFGIRRRNKQPLLTLRQTRNTTCSVPESSTQRSSPDMPDHAVNQVRTVNSDSGRTRRPDTRSIHQQGQPLGDLSSTTYSGQGLGLQAASPSPQPGPPPCYIPYRELPSYEESLAQPPPYTETI